MQNVFSKKLFFDYHKRFREFEGITEDVISVANEMSKNMCNIIDQDLRNVSKLDYALCFFTMINNSLKLRPYSYDFKVLMVISALDPNLIHLEASRSIKDLDDRQRFIRNEVGFYEPKLLEFERSYAKLFIESKNIVLGYSLDILDDFISRFEKITTIPKVLVDMDRVDKAIDYYISHSGSKESINNFIYVLCNQRELLGLKNSYECLVAFIRMYDPNLDYLRFFYDECTITRLQSKCIEEFGYYNALLIGLEKMYHKAFVPDMVVDDWDIKKSYN